MTTTTTTPLGVRLPQQLREELRQMAAENRRSLNSQIVVILEKETSQRTKTQKADAAA